MALSRNFQILEISGLHLDRPLVGFGPLSVKDATLASEARFIVAERVFQAGIDRRVDLVVMHSEILTPPSAAGRAPWLLGRCMERCAQAGIPVVWMEKSHNAWMDRFVATPLWVTRVTPGTTARITTRSGDILIHAGRAALMHTGNDTAHATIGIDDGNSPRNEFEQCDLLLQGRATISDRVNDFVSASQLGNAPPLAALHTLRLDRANSCEVLTPSPLGVASLTCSLGTDLPSTQLGEALCEETGAAAGRYFAEHPQTQLLLLDVNVMGHGPVWGSLWNQEQREALMAELNQRTRHPGCCVRSLLPMADSLEATRDCSFGPTVDSLWQTLTSSSSSVKRSLSDIAPESLALDDRSRHSSIGPDHPLGAEVRQAALQLLRSAS